VRSQGMCLGVVLVGGQSASGRQERGAQIGFRPAHRIAPNPNLGRFSPRKEVNV
jgi:hypothetical protein